MYGTEEPSIHDTVLKCGVFEYGCVHYIEFMIEGEDHTDLGSVFAWEPYKNKH